MLPTISTNPVIQVTAQTAAAIQHSTTTNSNSSFVGLLMFIVVMIALGYAILFTVAAAISTNGHNSSFALKVAGWVDREIHSMNRMGFKVSNCCWLMRCVFMKRWWQCRARYTPTANYGMSWEGKEKEYHKRYAAAK